jgi:hypothetical protein
MNNTIYFNLIGNNNKCVTDIKKNYLELDTEKDNKCMQFHHTRDNMLINNGACLTNNFKLGTKDCLKVNYRSDGIIGNDNTCYNNKTGKKESCVKTYDHYMRMGMRQYYSNKDITQGFNIGQH